jgi:hypothetical protein
MIKACKKYIDYIPFTIITLIFLSEIEIHNHAIDISYQLCTNIICISIFYFILYNCSFKHFKHSQYLAFMIASILWFTLLYIKKNHLF